MTVPKQRRHRLKGLPAIIEPTPEERFAAGVRDAELAKQRAAAAKEASRQAANELKVELERQQVAAAQHAADLARARTDRSTAVERLKAARQSGRGKAEAEVVWREATARLMELETGERPRWAPASPAGPTSAASRADTDAATEADEELGSQPVSA